MKKIIEQGKLIRNDGSHKDLVEYKMMFLNEIHLDDILALQDEVFKALEDPDTFVPDTKEFIEKSILPPKQGRIIGIFTYDGLIAYRTINFPGEDEKNLGRDIDLSKEDLDKVAHLESTVVHPNYRGNKLQSKMLPHTIKIIKDLGYNFILTTISPYNYPSLKNVMDHKLTIIDLKFRDGEYGGKLRYLLFVDLNNTDKNFTDSIIVKNTDVLKQQKLLKKGYEALKIEKQEGYFDVVYFKNTNIK